MCFWCSKEPSHWDGSFEYPQHMFWLGNKKKNFPVHTLICRPALMYNKVRGPREFFLAGKASISFSSFIFSSIWWCRLNWFFFFIWVNTSSERYWYPLRMLPEMLCLDNCCPQMKKNVVGVVFCLFDLILYIPVNNFSVMSGWVMLG